MLKICFLSSVSKIILSHTWYIVFELTFLIFWEYLIPSESLKLSLEYDYSTLRLLHKNIEIKSSCMIDLYFEIVQRKFYNN